MGTDPGRARDQGAEGEWRLVPLGAADASEMQALFFRSSDYFRVCTGSPPGPAEAYTELRALPPRARREQKTVLGVREGSGRLVGAVDIVRSWPDSETAMLGLLLLEPAVRDRGLGGEVLERLAVTLSAEGFRRIRAGVVSANEGSARFFRRHGFSETERVRRPIGGREREVLVFVRELERVEQRCIVQAAVLDMDGTLLDSLAASLAAVAQALADWGLPPVPEEDLTARLGWPKDALYRWLLPPERREEWQALRRAAQIHEQATMPDLARPFPGVRATLSALRERGVRLALIADCSPGYFAIGRSLLGIDDLVEWAACTGSDDKPKAVLAREAAEALGGGPAALVGDRKADVDAARDAGLLSVGCAYGYGDIDEADRVIVSPEGILEALCPPEPGDEADEAASEGERDEAAPEDPEIRRRRRRRHRMRLRTSPRRRAARRESGRHTTRRR